MKIILIAIKALMKFRLYTAVNILGLGLSLACCILLFRYVHGEITVDHFIQDLDRVCYLVTEDEVTHERRIGGILPEYGIKPNILEDPAVDFYAVLFQRTNDQIVLNDKMCNVATLATDTNYLKIIQLPIIKTSTDRLLHHPEDAVISEKLALRLFGNEDPMGKKLTTATGKIVKVVALMGEPSPRFSTPLDLLYSYEATDFKRIMGPVNLVKLKKGCSPVEVNEKYSKYYKTPMSANRVMIHFFPIEKFYFDKHLITYFDNRETGDYTYVLILSAIGVLILILGLFNFINVYTVLILKRAREYGMKKVFGANSRQIALQLYAENLCMVSVALLLSCVFVELGSLSASLYLTLKIPADVTFDISLFLGILLFLPFITSLYPFIQYSYSPPIVSVQSIGRSGNSTVSRNVFLCLQYIITMGLIVIAIYSVCQLDYMLRIDPGYKTENIIRVTPINMPLGNNMNMWNKYNNKAGRMDWELKKHAELFDGYTFNSGPITKRQVSTLARVPHGDWVQIQHSGSDANYFDLLGIPVVEGRTWNDSIDSELDMSLIINESAKKALGITDITQTTIVTNSVLFYISTMGDWPAPRYKVIGVVKDFCSRHLSKGNEPLLFYNYPSKVPSQGLLVGLKPDKKQEALLFLQKIYNEACGNGFGYTFLEDEVRALYDSDKELVEVASFFAFVAILISSLGLFSLSLFDIQQRFHEISIRKVNGATAFTILRMLYFKYYKLLGIAFLIAAPVSWLLITFYMEDFANKIDMSWWMFALAFLLTGGISFLTLTWQITKAARMNPAEVIKSE